MNCRKPLIFPYLITPAASQTGVIHTLEAHSTCLEHGTELHFASDRTFPGVRYVKSPHTSCWLIRFHLCAHFRPGRLSRVRIGRKCPGRPASIEGFRALAHVDELAVECIDSREGKFG